MLNFFFHKCGMRHEEFSFSSDSGDDFSLWKRNPLCSIEVRSKNIFCTHGTAILSINKKLELTNPALRNQLSDLQNQLFSIDHQKGELEKYVFEEEEEKRIQMQEKLNVLMLEYHKICDQIQMLISRLSSLESIKDAISENHNSLK